jgi:hypothetical protein
MNPDKKRLVLKLVIFMGSILVIGGGLVGIKVFGIPGEMFDWFRNISTGILILGGLTLCVSLPMYFRIGKEPVELSKRQRK